MLIHIIASKFNVGISVAIPATVLSINRRLYTLASPTSIIPSQADKNRELIIDLVIGIGLPIIMMVLCLSPSLSLYISLTHLYSALVAQSARFTIVEEYGCSSALYPSWVTLVIASIPPILLELIAGVYGCLSIRAFYKRSINLKSNRYIRLIIFSACDLLCGIPITLFFLYLNIKALVPFPGLEQEQLSQIFQLPTVVWRATTLLELSYELNRWIIVWGAFVFFAIFGFTEESRDNYRAVLQSVVQYFVEITGIRVKSRPSSSKTERCVTSFFFFCSEFSSDILEYVI